MRRPGISPIHPRVWHLTRCPDGKFPEVDADGHVHPCVRNTAGLADHNATGLAPGDVASATWTVAQLVLFAAAGASLGVVVSSYSKSPHTMRDATIGAVALPVLAIL